MAGPERVGEIRKKRVPDAEENYQACYCPGCPTYNQCMGQKEERLFCSRGRTDCPLTKLGCECGECDVAIKYALSRNYSCDNGPAAF